MENIIELINDEKFDSAYKLLKKNKLLNSYILDKNNFIHLCAIRGKEYIFKLLEDKYIDIYLSNGRGENILHLLLKNGWDNIALKIVKIYPDLLTYQNVAKYYPIINCVERFDTLKNMIKIILDNKYLEQINISSIEDTNLITRIIEFTPNEKNALEIIKMLEDYIDFSLPIKRPILFTAILKNKNVIAEYLIKNGYGINDSNENNLFPIHAIINVISLPLLKILLKTKSFDKNILNQGGPQNRFLPLNMCLNLIINDKVKSEYVKMTELIFKYLVNFDSLDSLKNSYGYYAAIIKMSKNNKKDKKDIIFDKIIKKSNKNLKNLEGITINDILENKMIDIKNKCKLDKNNIIKFPIIKFKSNTGLFNSDIVHNMIYFLYILKTYNNATIPFVLESPNNEKIKNNILQKLLFQNIPYNEYYVSMRQILGLGYETFYEMMPSIILWVDKNTHWFDPHFEDLIKDIVKSNKRFIIIKVSFLHHPEILHANVIIYDKEDSSYRRFEPYGNSSTYDEMYLDRLVMDIILKYKKTKIKYFTPGDFLETGRFQSISNDSSLEVKKTGDPYGYCLAWCLWYIEIKLKNPDIPEKKLIFQASEKIFADYCDSNTPYIDFIRDYARKLNDEKDKIFEKFGLDNYNFYNVSYDNTDLDKISIGISNMLKDFTI